MTPETALAIYLITAGVLIAVAQPVAAWLGRSR